ncbi:N-alkane-inducible cytochrome P450 [Mollisia scopiformis]|uniref:N-alkane-inducible cytochrome P450 n=1 Tax=Mollisia scopiformis TaxID=149040 RepID=A0A132BCK7_MOLSC|nr:N-alkane-inducible cytochrome P450 [Mollisia scopiformis]KUJ09387.1 N-alkane-inducible cytochrome P450 [Mollisia scopiformis]
MWTVSLFVSTILKQHGCEEPRKYPHKDPLLGLDYWRAQREAAQKSQWLPTSKRLFAKYGKTYEVNNLGQRMIHTMEPQNIQSVWATNFNSWGLQPLREGIAVPFFNHGINTTDGDFWRHSRALVRPTFARIEVANLGFLEKHVDRLFDQLPIDGSTTDLQPLFSCLFLDSSTDFLFGESMNLLLPDQRQECMSFIKAFDYCLYGLGHRVRLGSLRFLHRDKRWLASIQVVHEQVDQYIEKAIRSIRDTNGSDELAKKADRYVLLNEMAKQTQDKLDLRSQILTVFMPGRDSTAHALSNVFHVLARRPEVYKKLREEVLLHGDAKLTFETLRSMKYLQWVLNEGGKDGKSPIYVRKGDTVMASMWGLHQDRDIWGEDAAEFNPERWHEMKPIWTFVPFLGGPRTCPAQQLVLTQNAYVLARFVREFERIESIDPNPWTKARRIGFQSKFGVKVKLVRAVSHN